MDQAETNGCDEADFRNGGDLAVESAEMMQEEVRELNCILYSLEIFRHISVVHTSLSLRRQPPRCIWMMGNL